jgi:WD40 repeat protein/predicted Ser/Thr protein kinase
MTRHPALHPDSPPAQLARRVDRLCDRFEAAWKSGRRPKLERYLRQVPPAAQRNLLGELLVLELEYRAQRGDQPQREDYCLRFPEHTELIATIFVEASKAVPSTPRLVRRWTVHRLANELRMLLFPAGEQEAPCRERGARGTQGSALETPPFAWLLSLLDRSLGAGSPGLADTSSTNCIATTPTPQLGESSGDADLRPTRRGEDGDGSEAAISSLQDTPTQVLQPGTLPNGSVSGVENSAGTILGDYEILEQLGKGGMGIVYRALQRSTNRIVALKVIRADKLEHLTAQERQEWFERFRREGQIAACVEHDNLVAIYEMGHASGQYFYSMRFVEGQSLAEILRTGPLSNHRAASYMEPVARLMLKLHEKGIVHRDLKPKNILIDSKEERPFVTDFGLAKSSAYAQGLTQVEACMGTPEYIAPEQARNSATAREPSDIYSFGATLYELLTGRPPFRAADPLETLRQVREEEPLSPRRLNPAVHRDLELICLKCLQKEPQKRYANALELAEELRRYQTGEPLRHTRAVGKPERIWRWCRRNPLQASFIGLTMVALAAVTALLVTLVFIVQLREEKHQTQVLSNRLLTFSAIEQGRTLCEEGDTGRGLLWLARSLELGEPDQPDLEWGTRASWTGWSRTLLPLKAILPQDKELVTLALSIDGKTVFTATQSDAQLRDAHTGKPIAPPLVTPALILCAAFSPDGKLLLTGCRDNSARLWEVASGKLIGNPLYHDRRANQPVKALAFSPDGRMAVTGSWDRTAIIWDVATRMPIGQPLQHRGALFSVCFSAGGNRILTGSAVSKKELMAFCSARAIGWLGSALGQGPCVAAPALAAFGHVGENVAGEARLWDTATGRLIAQPLGHRREVEAAAFSSDGKAIVTVSGGTAQVWDLATGKSTAEPFLLQNGMSAVTFSAEGKWLLTGGKDGTSQLYGVSPLMTVGSRLHHRGRVTRVAFSVDGSFLVTGSSDKNVRLWEIQPPLSRPLPLNHQGDHIQAAALSLDGSMLATGSEEGNIQIWDSATGKARDLCPKHQGLVKAIAFGPDGKTLLTGALDEGRLWDVAGGIPVTVFRNPKPIWGQVVEAAYSPDGKTILTATLDGKVWGWDAAVGQPIGQLSQHVETVHRIAFSPNGKLFVTASEDCSAQVWDASTRQPIGPPLRHGGPVLAAVFNSDGRFVLTGSKDGTAQLWDAITGQTISPRLAQESPVWVVAFSPDDSLILTMSRDAVRLWDTKTGRHRGTLLQHQGVINAAVFSPDGRLVLTGSEDRTAKFWDAVTGKQCGPSLHHRSLVGRVLFTPDGKTALTTGYGETARFWDVPVPVKGSVERILLWTNVITGMRLDESGVSQVLDPADWEKACRHLQELGGPPVP